MSVWTRGSNRCHQTVINADGSLQMSRSIPTSEQHLRLAFSALGDRVRVHLESGELADWVSSVIKPFEAARRTKKDNSFKRAFEQSLEITKNTVHARLSAQRKILATLRAMWLSTQPYRDPVEARSGRRV